MNEPKPELVCARNSLRSSRWRRSGPTSMAIARSIRATHPAILRAMRAVTFQAPYEVRVEEKPEPELQAPDDAIVRVEATGVCGSDLHIYHGRVQIEPGFTIGHEFVGTVEAAGDAVNSVAEGDRVLGTFHTACGTCFFCRKGLFQKCDEARVYGHGATLGNLQGTQAEHV